MLEQCSIAWFGGVHVMKVELGFTIIVFFNEKGLKMSYCDFLVLKIN